MLQHELPGMVFPWERAQIGLGRHSRLAKNDMQQACAERLVQSLTGTDLQNVCSDTDKMFCSTWLGHDCVLVGSKCNKLRLVHLPSQTHQEVPYPAQPVHRQGPDLLARGNRAHCGQHDFSVSPSGCYLVTGGAAPEDIVLWRLQDSRDASTSSSCSSSIGPGSRIHMQPVQTFMGHADWVFGLDWLSDRHWVSGGRDGIIKLWHVPDAAAQGTYTTDPGSALLSTSYHKVNEEELGWSQDLDGGKVRAISFDQQQQQVVAVSTDETMSWWTPDLQLKGSARFSDMLDPVTAASNGPIVAVGSSRAVHVLDTRAPNAGYRSNSSSSSPGRKRSRSAAVGAHAGMGPQSAAAAAAMPVDDEEWARLQPYLQSLHVRWLPAAYPPSRPMPPVMLAVTGSARGMQEVQQASAAVGMDPVLAEQLLRQEAARQAIAQGQPFDAALEALVSRLMQLHPRQQLEELTALQEKSSQGAQQQPAQGRQGGATQRGSAGRLEQAAERMTELLASGQHIPAAWLHRAHQMFPGLFPAPGGDDADDMNDDAGYDSDPYGDGYSDYDDDDEFGTQQQRQQQFGALARLPLPARLAVADSLYGADLPNALRNFQERTQPRSQYAFNGDVQRMQSVQQLQQGGLPLPGRSTHDLKARVSSKLEIPGGVRSVSIQNDYILGVGHVSLDFYDMRRMHGQQIYTSAFQSDSSLLLRRLEMQAHSMNLDPVLREYGFREVRNMQSAVYTHCWDPSGTRVLAAGGALPLGCRGAFVQVLT